MAMLRERDVYDWHRQGDTFGQAGWEHQHPRSREFPPPSHLLAHLVILAIIGGGLTALALTFAGRL